MKLFLDVKPNTSPSTIIPCSWVAHASRGLVWLITLRVDTRVPDDRLFLRLDELTATTAVGGKEVGAGVAFHAILFLLVSTLKALEDRGDAAVQEGTVGEALSNC
jgi:hypothetical protein